MTTASSFFYKTQLNMYSLLNYLIIMGRSFLFQRYFLVPFLIAYGDMLLADFFNLLFRRTFVASKSSNIYYNLMILIIQEN
ncbi:hypothetical protein ACJX0J_018588, partial [Zea mays]